LDLGEIGWQISFCSSSCTETRIVIFLSFRYFQSEDPTSSRWKTSSKAFPYTNRFVIWIYLSKYSRDMTNRISSYDREWQIWISS
jgi:hypothetical protein